MKGGETLMGFDFGMARIGVATGTPAGGCATPLATLKAVNGEPQWDVLNSLVNERSPHAFVVGYPPVIEDGMRTALEHFVDELGKRYEREVVLCDEAYSSAEARARIRELRSQGLRGRSEKEHIDKIAAAIILEDYLAQENA